MADQIRKNVPNFIPMGQASGERIKPDNPVELDAEGKPINPHIPQFISKAPWYIDTGAKASLKHQRLNNENSNGSSGDKAAELKNSWYSSRGTRAGPAATKYRKGACENCGASSHKTKDCLERPRKIGAKWNGRDIQADEVVQQIETTWDSKRDRANGYDFDSHTAMLKATYDRMEALRKEDGVDIVNDGEGEKGDDPPRSIADQTKSISNSHMRIMEDVAGYLKKGSETDAYDPKTRTMRESIDKEGFTRGSKDVAEFEKMQLFAFNASTKAATTASADATPQSIIMQAAPSQAALLYKQQQEAKASEKALLLEKYGSESTALPSHLLDTSAEERVYSKDGKLLQPARKIQSRYAEDVFKNGHSAVWGSWYDKESHEWGYACCKATTKNAYCLTT